MTLVRPSRLAALATALAAGATLLAQETTESISGRIVSATTGRPIPGARASASIADYGMAAQADADGRFRVAVREPGQHRLSASAPGYLTGAFGNEPEIGQTLVMVKAGEHVGGLEIRLHRGATIAGVVTDDMKEPFVSGTVRALAKRLVSGAPRFVTAAETKTDDRGAFRLIGLEPGQYAIGAIDRTAMTLAPSAAAPAAAMLVAVAADEVRNGVNIQMRSVGTGSVEGVVVGPDAASPRLTVQLAPDPDLAISPSPASRPAPGGRFVFADVPSGRYNLIVRPGLNGEPPRAWGIAPIVVAPGATARATIKVSGEPVVSGIVDAVGVRQLTIRLNPVGVDRPEASPNSVRATARGSFVIPGVAPGRYHLEARLGQSDFLPQFRIRRLEEPATHRLLSTVFVKGEDVTDSVFVVGSGSIDGVRVTVTETAARISGIVLDAAGRPTTTGAVIVAATDARYWTPVSRRIRVTRADTDGVFHAPLLPAGRYRVAHVTSLAPGHRWDPAFLRSLAGAREVTVREGEVSNVELRLK
jgi:hypothetical protein